MAGAEPVFKKGTADFAVLLLHGFKATTFEMKEFGNYLHDGLSCTISIPLLPKHGIDYQTVNKSKWTEWHSFAVQEFKKLKQDYDDVFIVGMSMGGNLALRVASELKPKGVFCVGTPYKLHWKTSFAHLLKFFIKRIKDYSGPDIKNQDQKNKAVTLYSIPLVGLVELIKMLKDSRKLYSKVTSPVFLAHSENDHVIPYQNMTILKSLLKENVVGEKTYQNSYHIIPLDNDRHDLFETAKSFIQQHQ